MTIFYVTLLLVYIFSLLARITSNKRTGRASIMFTIIVTLILTIVSGLRTNIGDTSMYVHTYNLIGPDYKSGGEYEAGFILILKILKSISEDPQFMIMIISIVVNLCIVFTLWKYSKYYYFEIATFLYVASGYYLVTMNGIRQCLAASILFAATPFLIKRKTVIYMIIVALTITIHSSAFIMIPMYFIVNVKPWSKQSGVLIICTLIAMFLYNPLMNLAVIIVGSKMEAYQNSTEGGTNIIRVAVFFVPVFLSYLKKENINRVWNRMNIFVNMNLLSFLVMVFALIQWVFARFTLYLQPYTFILMGYTIKNCFMGKERRILYYGLIVCYTLFFFIECPSNLNGVPYATNFSINDFLYK